MSNLSAKSTATSTIPKLITQRIKEKGLSPSELVSIIGYTNISKGTRRLNNFLNTLEAPAEEFITKLLSILEIDALSFNKAVNASLDQFSVDAKRIFKPYIEVLLGIQVRPAFAYQAVKNQCSIPVPAQLQNQPLSDELEAIMAIHKDHVANALSDNITKHIIGFRYHREHGNHLQFNTDFVLEEVVFIQSLPSGKRLLGNRVIDLLSGCIG